MRIGVLGSGQVAHVLADGFRDRGHEVTLGTRDPAKLAPRPVASIQVADFAAAAAFGELIVLAVKGAVALQALQLAGAQHLAGKVVIDVTNPIADAPPVNGVLRFFTSLDEALMERLQRAFPAARFVKAFNSVGSARMINPSFRGARPTMFICGNDMGAKGLVTGVLEQFGWDSADMGSVEAARAIEPLCMLWCIPLFLRGESTHAFALLHS